MPDTRISRKLEVQNLAVALQKAAQILESNPGDLELDFSSIRRVDTVALRSMENLAQMGQQKTAKIVLRGVNVDVYKTLKLAKLAQRFSFVS
jgi:anti-anti-sigma regulatory factor